MPKTRYGRWTVLDPTAIYRAHDKVPCICDCGNLGEPKRYKLTQGRSESCGCLAHERLRRTSPELAPARDDHIAPGTRHGRWTALTPPYLDPGYRERVAQVRCECGTEKIVRAYDLLAGKNKSCGCLVADANRARLTSNQGA